MRTPGISRTTRTLGLVVVASSLSAIGCGGSAGGGTTTLSAADRAVKDREARMDFQVEQTRKATEAKRREIARLRKEVALAKELREAEAAGSGGSPGGSDDGASGGSGGRASGGKLFSVADRRSFRALEASLGGASGVAVSGVGKGRTVSKAGSFQTAIAWSTSKVPVAMAAIADGSAAQGALTQAITASDNASAETLWQGLGGGEQAAAAATAQLRAAGDQVTRIQPTVLRSGFTAFGQTSWTLGDQVRFTAGLPCSDAGREVLGLMARTIPAQRWGLGSTSWSASLKGGWGPGTSPGEGGGYVDRQMGILTSGGRQLAVTIMTRPAAGSHEAGTANLTRIAAWVVAHVDVAGLPTEASC